MPRRDRDARSWVVGAPGGEPGEVAVAVARGDGGARFLLAGIEGGAHGGVGEAAAVGECEVHFWGELVVVTYVLVPGPGVVRDVDVSDGALGRLHSRGVRRGGRERSEGKMRRAVVDVSVRRGQGDSLNGGRE